jgi:excisionase family DNA binding protein
MFQDRMPLAYSVPEAAEALRLSIPHIWREIARGNIGSIKVGRRRILTEPDLIAYLEARRVAT